MKQFILFCINRLVGFFSGLSSDDFRYVQDQVRAADTAFTASPDKKRFVVSQIKMHWPALRNSVINLLIELAVAALRKNLAK